MKINQKKSLMIVCLIGAALVCGCGGKKADFNTTLEEQLAKEASYEKEIEEEEKKAEEAGQEKVEENESAGYAQVMIDDIHSIETTLKYSVMKEQYKEEAFEELIGEIEDGSLDKTEALLKLREIIAGHNIVHLQFDLGDDSLFERRIPISLEQFEEGYYIFSADPQYKDYLGCRLIAINGITVDQLVEKLSRLYWYENENSKKAVLTKGAWEIFYQYVGIMGQDDNSVTYTVEKPDGRQVSFEAQLQADAQIQEEYVIDFAQMPSNYRYYYLGQDSFRYEPAKQGGIMYFMYYSCQENTEGAFAEALGNMLSEMAEGDYSTLVFDLRRNGGGNRGIAANAMRKYRDEISKYKVVCICDERTFSAAMQFMEDAGELCGDISIYGTESGESITNFTELRGLHLKSNPEEMLYYPIALTDEKYLASRAEDTSRGVLPDVEVRLKFSDLMQGRDSVYEQIEADFGGKQK